MFISKHRVWQVGAMAIVGCFIAFTIYCWLFDFFESGEIEVRNVGACTAIWAVALISSPTLWRAHLRFAVFGLLASLLGMVWMLLPRLHA